MNDYNCAPAPLLRHSDCVGMTEVAPSALPNAGTGLFTARAFSCGDVVLDETPLFYTRGAGQYASSIWRLTAQVLDAGASETIEVRARVWALYKPERATRGRFADAWCDYRLFNRAQPQRL